MVDPRRIAYPAARWLIVIAVVAFGAITAIRAVRELRERDQQILADVHALDQQIEELTAADPINSVLLEDKRTAREQLWRQRLYPRHFQWSSLALAAAAYALALITSSLFWAVTLRAFAQPIRLPTTIAAHALGQLGKYVPGKAMVVVIRSSTLQRAKQSALIPAVIAVFVETLTMMACGATIAGLIVLWLPAPAWIRWLALCLALAAAFPTAPPIFRRVLRKLERSRFGKSLPAENQRYDLPLMGQGWLLMSITWLLIGTSFWWVLQATPGASTTIAASSVTGGSVAGVQGWLLATATIALAMVAGFLSLIPGGAGVRELVITGLLATLIQTGPALVAAVVVRLLFLIVEAIVSGLAWVYLRRQAAPS